MKKSIAVLVGCLMVGAFAMNANAGRTKCTVSAVKDNAVIMDCGKQTSSLKVGTVVTLKTKATKKSVIEGC